MSVVRGCLAQIGCLSVIGAAAVLLWLVREPAWEAAKAWLGRPAAPPAAVVRVAPDVADSAEAKVAALRPDGEVRLTASEAQSWVTYRVEPVLPDYVRDLRVALLDSQLQLDARVETRRVPGVEAAGPFADLVGDTAEVTVVGRVDGVGGGRGAFFVERAFVGGVPLPNPVRDRLLAPLRVGADDLPPNALAFPLPPPAWDVAVRDGVLILRSGWLE